MLPPRKFINIHMWQPEMNRDKGYNLPPIHGTILQPHQNEAVNNIRCRGGEW